MTTQKTSLQMKGETNCLKGKIFFFLGMCVGYVNLLKLQIPRATHQWVYLSAMKIGYPLFKCSSPTAMWKKHSSFIIAWVPEA